MSSSWIEKVENGNNKNKDYNNLPAGFIRDVLLKHGGEFPEPSPQVIEYQRQKLNYPSLTKVTEESHPKVLKAADSAARKVGIPTPYMYIAGLTNESNASIHSQYGHITVTAKEAALPQKMLEGVLLHEIGHGFQPRAEKSINLLRETRRNLFNVEMAGVNAMSLPVGVFGMNMLLSDQVQGEGLKSEGNFMPTGESYFLKNIEPSSGVMGHNGTTALTSSAASDGSLFSQFSMPELGSPGLSDASLAVASSLLAVAIGARILGLLSGVAQKAVQRHTEFKADEFAAKKHGNTQDVVDSLEKLEKPKEKLSWLQRINRTHPLPEERISHVKSLDIKAEDGNKEKGR